MKEERKAFFSEEKKQKTLVFRLHQRVRRLREYAHWHNLSAPRCGGEAKVFCFFPSEKKGLLPSFEFLTP